MQLLRSAVLGMRYDTMARRNESARKRAALGRGDAIDLTLIRWMAHLTPSQRLAVLQDHIKLVNVLRRATPTH